MQSARNPFLDAIFHLCSREFLSVNLASSACAGSAGLAGAIVDVHSFDVQTNKWSRSVLHNLAVVMML